MAPTLLRGVPRPPAVSPGAARHADSRAHPKPESDTWGAARSSGALSRLFSQYGHVPGFSDNVRGDKGRRAVRRLTRLSVASSPAALWWHLHARSGLRETVGRQEHRGLLSGWQSGPGSRGCTPHQHLRGAARTARAAAPPALAHCRPHRSRSWLRAEPCKPGARGASAVRWDARSL